jgi:hypothetical protein
LRDPGSAEQRSAHVIVSGRSRRAYDSQRVLFSSHLLCFQHFLCFSLRDSAEAQRGNRLVNARG